MTSGPATCQTAQTTCAAPRIRDPKMRTKLRKLAGGCHSSVPIVIVNGVRAPHLMGRDAYYTTMSGKTVVHHPNAYKWRTWRHPSTRRIEVGIRWAERRGIAFEVAKSPQGWQDYLCERGSGVRCQGVGT